MQPQESPGNMLLFLCHCIVTEHECKFKYWFITNLFNLEYYIYFQIFKFKYINYHFPKTIVLVYEDLRHQNGRTR